MLASEASLEGKREGLKNGNGEKMPRIWEAVQTEVRDRVGLEWAPPEGCLSGV